MSTLRTYNLQNPDSSNVNIELTQGSGAVVAGVATFSSDVRVSGNLTVGGVLTYDDVTNIDSVGIITAQSDVSIADKIVHTGDTNTAIRFPAVDTITTETAGTERLRITSTGNIGIGTDNPSRILHVSSNNDQYIRVTSTTSGNAGIEFGDSADKGKSNIVYANSDDSMFFTVNGSEKLRITSEGSALLTTDGQSGQYSYAMKLGQGAYLPNDSTAPHYGLWVRQLGPRYEINYGVYSEVEDDNGFYGGETIDGLSSVRGVGVYGGSPSSAQAYQKGIGVYGKATNESYNYNTVIGVRGRVETGTTSFLNNNGQKSYGGHFVATGKSDVIGVYADAYLAGSPGANQEAIPLLVSSNGSERLRVDSSARVIIDGSASGNNKLQINGTGNDTAFVRLKRTNGAGNDSAYGGINVIDNNDVTIGTAEFRNQDSTTRSQFVLSTYNVSTGGLAEALRVRADGQVNINASSESIGGKVVIKNNVDYTATDFDDNPTLYLLNGDQTTGISEAAIILAGRNTSGSTYRAAISGNGSSGIKFHPSNNAELDHTPAMLINNNNRIGINVTSPEDPLHVKNTSSAATSIRIQTGTSSTNNGDEYSSVIFDGNGYVGAKIASHRDDGTWNDRGDLRFYSGYGNNVFTQRMRITNTGGVIIGSGNNNSSMSEFGSNTGGLTIDDVGVNNTGIRLSHGNDDSYLIQSSNGNFYISQYGTGSMIIGSGSSGTERLRISGNAEAVHVKGESALTGTTGGAKGLSLAVNGANSCPLYFGTETHSAQKSMYLNGYWIYLRGHQNEGIRFIFSQGSGNAPRSDQYQFKYNQATRPTGNTTWDGFSDRRAKENVQDVTSALDTICRLRPVTFDWTNDYADRMNMFNMDKTDPKSYNWFSVKENGYDETRKNNNVGFIAQEFEEVFPKDITETEMELGDETITDFKTVNFDSLVPMLTKAVQELKAENDSLKARLDAAGL